MPVQKAVAKVGFGKQTAKGTVQATNLHALGVSGGTFAEIDIKQDPEELTSGTRNALGVVRSEASVGASFTTRAFTKNIYALLAAALGQDAVTGAGPYVHTATVPTAASLPYLSVRGSFGTGAFITQISDAMIDELTLKWDKSGLLEVDVTLVGTTLTLGASLGTITNDVTNDASDVFGAFSGTNSVFKYAVDSATSVAGTIMGGEISIKNNLEVVPVSGQITPYDVFPAGQEIEWTLKITPDDVNDWRKIVTGSVSGTAVSGVPLYGSADVTFAATTTAAHSLQIKSDRIAFLTDFPEADPKGGPVTFDLKGVAVLPTAGTTPITAITTNGITPAF